MGGDFSMPMDDASMSTNLAGNNDASNNGDIPQDIEDPMMGGEEMPNASMDAPQEPIGSEGDDSTVGIINQLSDEDKKAVRAYAESMLAKNSSGDESDMGEMPNNEGIAESAIFSKKQIEMLRETFGINKKDADDCKEKPLNKKENIKNSKKSPFNNPKFN